MLLLSQCAVMLNAAIIARATVQTSYREQWTMNVIIIISIKILSLYLKIACYTTKKEEKEEMIINYCIFIKF